jgi:hypothetical protein
MMRWVRWSGRALMPAAISAGLGACSASSEGGIRVDLVSGSDGVVASQELSLAGGARLRIDSLFWTITEIELRACPSAWQRAADFLVATAYAHGVSTPTVLAVPTVESVAAPTDTALGHMNPPAGDYCSVRYQLGPADADAEGLAGAPDMLGRSLFVRGTLELPGGAAEAFELESERTLEVELPAELSLSADQQHATLRFEQDAERLLAAVDWTLEGVRRELALLEALSGSLSVQVE